ncbi:hypothetical protein BC941DRAFT_519690 [Chlamydoabsidia padenii]|nr:hypothetical protein BC941DRAFT_519690 [Chlamydoabsidia padenii]
MDDLYQYTASAVNSNNNNSEQDAQNDPLIKAFTNFGWGQRFTNLMDTVKKQGEVLVDVTKKDLQQFADILREDDVDSTDQLSTTSTNTITEPTRNDTLENSNLSDTTPNRDGDSAGLYASLREGLLKINTVNFSALRQGLEDTLTNQPFLPSQLTSIKLPDNISLGELRQELEQGTRFAELYMQKFGTEVLQVLNKTITVLEPDTDKDDDMEKTDHLLSSDSRPRIFASRAEALVAKLQTDRDTLLTDPKQPLMANNDEKQLKVLETFNAGFNIEEYTAEISRLLDDSPDLRQTMDDLVPIKVDYTTFWKRYFYHTWRIDQEEQKRKLIVKGANQELDEDDDFKWDSDDEDMSNTLEKGKQRATDVNETNKSDTDYSNISEPPSTEASLVSPPLKSQVDVDEWVTTKDNKEQHHTDNDDSDSDWE